MAWEREAAARPRWTKSLHCEEAWGRVLKTLGLELEELWEEVVALAIEAREDPRSQFALPRLRVSVSAEDDPLGWAIFAEPELELPPGWQIECRVRWGPGEAPTLLKPSGWAGPFQTFFLRARDLRVPPEAQLGLSNPREPALERGIWEEWNHWEPIGQ